MKKLYTYCLAERVDGLPESITGVSGAKVRAITFDKFAALVSGVDGDSVPVTRDNVLYHEGVVRSLLETTTPLPFRFGTLATEQQLQSYVSSRHAALGARFDAVRDCVEMGVKIIWDKNAAGEELESQEKAEVDYSVGMGAAFLMEKRNQIIGSELLAEQAAALQSWLSDKLRGLVREEKVTTRPAEKLVLAAAHLVERSSVESYKQKLAELREERLDLHFLVSGPWAPYSFANIDLEFETHFGVS